MAHQFRLVKYCNLPRFILYCFVLIYPILYPIWPSFTSGMARHFWPLPGQSSIPQPLSTGGRRHEKWRIYWISNFRKSEIPSGKPTKNHGKSPFSMGKSTTVFLWPFSIAILVYQRLSHMRTMVLVYLPTWLGDLSWANVGIHIPAPWSIWLWEITMFHRYLHYFDWAIFNS
jgi:hypothetical protein